MTTYETLPAKPNYETSPAGRNAVTLMAADVVSRAMGLAAFAVVARAVGPNGFGQLNLALGGLALLALVSDPGLQYVAQRSYVSSGANQEIIARITALRVVLALASLMSAGVAFAMTEELVFWLVLVYAVSLVPSAGSLAWLYTAEERMGLRALGQLVGAFAFTVFVLLFVQAAPDLSLVPWGLVCGNALSALVLWMFAPRPWRESATRPTLTGAGSVLREALPFGGSLLLAQALVWIQTFLLAALLSANDVGIFHAAYRWVLLALGVGIYFPQALFPVMVRRRGSSEGDRLIEEATRFVVAAGVLVALLLSGASGMLVSSAFGRAYGAAVPVLLIAAWVVPFALHNSLAAHHLNANGRERTTLGITAIAVVTNVGLNLLLIPSFGPSGAALALVAAEIMSLGLCLAALHNLGARLLPMYRSSALALLAAVSTLGLVHAALPAVAALASAVFVGMLVLLGEINVARWRALRDVIWIRESESVPGVMVR